MPQPEPEPEPEQWRPMLPPARTQSLPPTTREDRTVQADGGRWQHQLQETWRRDADQKASEVRFRTDRLRLCPLFAKRTTKQLRMLALAMEDVEYVDGEVIFAQGDASDGSVYLLDSGAVAVHVEGMGQVAALEDAGEIFGELCLFLDGPRSATVRAQGFTSLFRVIGSDAMHIMEAAWGNREELQRRAGLLRSTPFFEPMRTPELMKLATALEPKRFQRPGVDIVIEGQLGDTMYVVETGHPTTQVRGVGRVSELRPGQIFGEIAILEVPRSYRTATVTTADMETVVLALRREDVFRLVPEAHRDKMLQQGKKLYQQRESLRHSEAVSECIELFWATARVLTEQQAESNPECLAGIGHWDRLRRNHLSKGLGWVSRDAYEQLHVRIASVFHTADLDFDHDKARELANLDWIDDMTMGQHDKNVRVSAWAEKVKAKLHRALGATVSRVGWCTLFKRYDSNNLGTLELDEFVDAVRNDLGIHSKLTLSAFKTKKTGALASRLSALAHGGGGHAAGQHAEMVVTVERDELVRKPHPYLLRCHFVLIKDDQFTKTGSGQTYGKHSQRGALLFFATGAYVRGR